MATDASPERRVRLEANLKRTQQKEPSSMYSIKCKRFKGEIETYLSNEKNIFESRMDRVFRTLNVKTQMNQVNIRKRDGYHAAHLLFVLSLLPLLKIPTIHGFCLKRWDHWCMARKDAFYRFQKSPSRWRSFMYAVIHKAQAVSGLNIGLISEVISE